MIVEAFKEALELGLEKTGQVVVRTIHLYCFSTLLCLSQPLVTLFQLHFSNIP